MTDEGAVPAGAPRTKRALVLVETGIPEKADEARGWLTRVYSDPAVMDTPFGTEYQRLFSAALALFKVKGLRSALESNAGASEREGPQALASAITARLQAGAEEWMPLVALRHGSPSMADAVRSAGEAGCSRVIFLFARPFAAPAGSGSAAIELRQLAATYEELELSLIDRFDGEFGVRAAWAASLRDALASLPEDARSGAEILFTLRGQPVPGTTRDPVLDSAEPFSAAVKSEAGVENHSSIAFQCRTEPRADFAPSLDDALERIAGEKRQALVVVPLTHAVETLATRWELDRHFAEQARARGVAHFARAACPSGRPELADALATVVRRHLAETSIPSADAGSAA